MAQTAEGRRNADRIKSIARNRHMNVQEALKRFALERLLYRLSANDDAHRWLLKGGALFWLDDDGEGASGIRPTSDIDLHFHENVPMSEVEAVVRHAVGIDGGDGVVLTVGKVSDLGGIDGMRIVLSADIGGSKTRAQIDVGFGGRKPEATAWTDFPTLIKGLPAPRVQALPWEYVVAEKLHASLTKGMENTRIRDIYDLCGLSRRGLEVDAVAEAILHTFEVRGTDLPVDGEVPIGLTDAFAAQDLQAGQWITNIGAWGMSGRAPATLLDAVGSVRPWIAEVLDRAREMRAERSRRMSG